MRVHNLNLDYGKIWESRWSLKFCLCPGLDWNIPHSSSLLKKKALARMEQRAAAGEGDLDQDRGWGQRINFSFALPLQSRSRVQISFFFKVHWCSNWILSGLFLRHRTRRFWEVQNLDTQHPNPANKLCSSLHRQCTKPDSIQINGSAFEITPWILLTFGRSYFFNPLPTLNFSQMIIY